MYGMAHNYSLSASRVLTAAAIAPLCFSLIACSDDAETSGEPEFSEAAAAAVSSSTEETYSEEITSESEASETESDSDETTESEPTNKEDSSTEAPAESGEEKSEDNAAASADSGRGDCSPEALQPAAPSMTNIRVNDCDGQWAHFGKDSTDWTVWARYEDGQWVAIESIGEATSGLTAPCYDVDKWAAEGAPAFLTENMRRCD